MTQAARQIATAKFRARKAAVLVVTDVAARGLDIPLLDNVINYDFPAKPKLFVHRAGGAHMLLPLPHVIHASVAAFSSSCRESSVPRATQDV